jgi:hypothetical protein
MNRWLVLGGVLCAVLAAAIAYALLGEEHPPATAGMPRAQPGSKASDVQRPGEPAPRLEDSPTPEAAAEPDTSAPRPDGQPWRTVEPSVTQDAPPPPLAESPFTTENSAEIDYAFQLVFGPDAGVDHARAAIDVFDRCLKVSPQNRRCYDGLVAAQQRLEPGWQPPAAPQPLAPPRVGPPPPPRTVPVGEPARTPPADARPMKLHSK